MTFKNALTILLADDNALVRRNLRLLLKADKHFIIVGEAADGREAVQMAAAVSADVILMDISMPILNGLEAARRILAANPLAKVIMLSAYDDEVYVERARALGVAGFLAKQRVAETLTKTIRDIAEGRGGFWPVEGRRSFAQSEKPWDKGAAFKSKGCLALSGVEPLVRLKII